MVLRVSASRVSGDALFFMSSNGFSFQFNAYKRELVVLATLLSTLQN